MDATEREGEEGETPWAYTGPTGPEHWGRLDPCWAPCAQGRAQSPIDLGGAVGGRVPSLAFAYRASSLVLSSDGRTVRADFDEGSVLRVDDEPFALVQLHFHAPSEHVVDGRRHAMEMHLVHEGPRGELLVLGVFLAPGSGGEPFAPIFERMPAATREARAVGGVSIDATAFLPAGRTLYAYEGSLTTPPCTEGVRWLVFEAPVAVFAEHVAAFTEAFGESARPLQPRDGRMVVLGA